MRLFQTTQPDPAPPEQPPETVKVFCDGTLHFAEIPWADFRDYQSRGYRLLPANAKATDLPQPAPASSGLALTQSPQAGSQAGTWAWWEAEARDALVAAASALAPLAEAEPLDPRKFTGPKADILSLYSAAITARAVVALAARVQALESELAALKAAGKGE